MGDISNDNDRLDINNFIGQIIDSSVQGLIVVDEEGKMIYVSTAIERFFGYTKEDLFNQQVELLVPIDKRGQHTKYRKEYQKHPLEKKMGEGRDLLGLRKDGSEIPIEIGLSSIQLSNTVYTIATVQDISKRTSVEFETRRLQGLENTILELSNVRLRELAHDLQQPLAAILVYLHLIREVQQNTQEANGYIDKVDKLIQKMSIQLRDLPAYCEGLTKDHLNQDIDLNALFVELIDEMEFEIAQADCTIEFDTLPKIQGNYQLMKRVFQNLLNNSIKYKKPHNKLFINIQGRHENGNTIIEFRDNGIGFDMKDADEVFTMYTRLETEEVHEGSGIGLSICKKIIEMHDGAIQVTSKLAEGTILSITLPEKP